MIKERALMQTTEETPNYSRISGDHLARRPYEAVQEIVEILRNTEIEPHMLRNMVTFEQTNVAVFVRQFHLMVQKQRGYGTKNIAALKDRGVLKRIEEKVLRGYEEIGDPETQVERLKALQDSLDDEATPAEMVQHLRKIDDILNPGGSNEDTVDNLALDISNLGEILYVVMNDAWGHPLEERLDNNVEVIPNV